MSLFLVSLVYSGSKYKLSILQTIRVMMTEPGDFEIIAGVGNEVFYFFGKSSILLSSHSLKLIEMIP